MTPRLPLAALLLALAAPPAGAVIPELRPDPALEAVRDRIEAGDPAGALADLDRLLALRPGDKIVLTLYGFAHRRLGNPDVARGWYDRALAIDPELPAALEYLGELELAAGRIEAARALERRLMAACPMGCDELDDLRAAFRAAGF